MNSKKKIINKKTQIKEYIKNHLYILVFILYFPFAYSLHLSNRSLWLLDTVFKILRVLSFILILYLFIKEKKKITKLSIVVVLICLWELVVTALNNSGETLEYIFIVCSSLATGLLIEVFVDKKRDLIKGLLINYELALYPNLLTLLLYYPNGYNGTRYFLLGYENNIATFIIPAVFISFVYMYDEKKLIRPLLLLITCLVSTVLIWSATMILSLFVFFGIIFLFNVVFKEKNPLIYFYVIITIILNLFVIFIYSNINIPIIDKFITCVLKRSTDFTGRTVIWNKVFDLIKENPILGYGYKTRIITNNDVFAHCHNELLQRIFISGIIGLALFVLFHSVLLNKIKKYVDYKYKALCTAAICATYMTFITESYDKYNRFLVIYFVCYCFESLVDNHCYRGPNELENPKI